MKRTGSSPSPAPLQEQDGIMPPSNYTQILIYSLTKTFKMNALKNQVRLIGFLGADPEVKTLESGKKLARFSLATNESWTNDKGEKVTETTWHNLVAWEKVAEIVERFLLKGSEVAIEGKLVNNSYEDKEGVTRYSTQIQVNELLLLGKKATS